MIPLSSDRSHDVRRATDGAAWSRRILLPLFVGYAALGLAACGNGGDVKKSGDGAYEIELGAGDQLCQKYAAHLETLPPRPKRPNQSCLPPLPDGPDFSAIEFETLAPLEHMDIVKEMGFAYEGLLSVEEKAEIDACERDRDCLDRLWTERDWLLARAMRNIESGIYVLRQARFDLNGDGKPETVYLHRNTRRTAILSPKPKLPLCTPWGEHGVRDRDLNLIVRESDDAALHQHYRNALFYGDVAYYDGQVFLVRSGSRGVTLFNTENEEAGNAANAAVACVIRPK